MTMRTLHYAADAADCSQSDKKLVILLPGALQQPEDFAQAGFVSVLRRHAPDTDLTLVDLGLVNIGDVNGSALLERIDAELVRPARQHGYRTIWMVGISIGGLLALAHAERYRNQVQCPDPGAGSSLGSSLDLSPGLSPGLNLGLLSPYPGNRLLQREIAIAGGLGHWRPRDGAEASSEQAMWHWLQGNAGAMRVHLGYGSEDRFADGIALMSTSARVTSTEIVSGGHDWKTWTTLWDGFLVRYLKGTTR